MTAKSSRKRIGIRPRRLTHANLFVHDLERSMQFYTKICGFEEVFREVPFNAGFVSNGNSHHDVAVMQVTPTSPFTSDEQQVFPEGFGTRPGLFHLGFEMENEADLVIWYKRAKEAGLKSLMTFDHRISRSVYFLDPDGNLLEYYADRTKDWRSVFDQAAARSESITTQWIPGHETPSTDRNYSIKPEIKRVANSVFHAARTRHAVLAVSDLEKSLAFYTAIAGLKEVDRIPDPQFVLLRGQCPGYDIGLLSDKQTPLGVHHIGFEVADDHDFEDAETKLTEHKVDIECRLDNKSKRSVFLKDPDDIRVELFVEHANRSDRLSAIDPATLPYLA
jgi:catechol 2,3-dioxygenase